MLIFMKSINRWTAALFMFLLLLVTYLYTGSVSSALCACLYSEKGKQPAALSWPDKEVRPIRRRISRPRWCCARISSSKEYSEALCPLSDCRLYFQRIIFFLFRPKTLQHFAVLLKYVIHVAIPDIPTWVREEMAKLDYQRREAFKVNHVKEENVICHGEVAI